MTDDQSNQEQQKPMETTTADDFGTVNVVGFVRIFDPETNETLVETRA